LLAFVVVSSVLGQRRLWREWERVVGDANKKASRPAVKKTPEQTRAIHKQKKRRDKEQSRMRL
jgi:hypothetical protein